MDKPHQVTPDIEALPAHFPIPGMGFLAVNAFVIKATEPVLVDTCRKGSEGSRCCAPGRAEGLNALFATTPASVREPGDSK
jgi:hypothetical protein